MVDAIYLVICFFRRIELNYFSVFISFIITIPPTSIYNSIYQMECCGFSGPQEFAYSTLPIDDSCYEPHTDNSTDEDGSSIARSDWDETTFTTPNMRLKQVMSFPLKHESYLFLTGKKGTLDICLFYPETQCRR